MSSMAGSSVDLGHLNASLKAALHSVDEGVHIVDMSGVTVFYNSAAATLHDLEPAEVEGRHILAVFPSLSDDTNALLWALRTGRAAGGTRTLIGRDGQPITTINSTLPVYAGARLIGAVEVCRDVSLLRRLAEALQTLQAQLVAEAYGRPQLMPNRRAGAASHAFSDVVASGQKMRSVVAAAREASSRSLPVLLWGEAGTGKKLLAQCIHSYSVRAWQPFISQDCAALPGSLLANIIFGTARCPWTGVSNMPGLFEVADGGTLCLQQVQAIPADLRARLGKAIRDGAVARVGEQTDRSVDVRLVATAALPAESRANLDDLVEELFGGADVAVIEVPPLRERRDDIGPLVEHFIRHYAQEFRSTVRGVADDVMALLRSHSWPGNVAELQRVIESAVQVMQGDLIGMEHLPAYMCRRDHEKAPTAGSSADEAPRRSGLPQRVADEEATGGMDLNGTLRQVEMNMICLALAKHENNISAAARELGLPRQTLQNRMKRLGIRE